MGTPFALRSTRIVCRSRGTCTWLVKPATISVAGAFEHPLTPAAPRTTVAATAENNIRAYDFMRAPSPTPEAGGHDVRIEGALDRLLVLRLEHYERRDEGRRREHADRA